MLGEVITNSLVLILGYAYPAFECFKTIEKHSVQNSELRFWCQYWVIVAILTVLERIGDIFISWVPMYGEMKLALFIYLWYPKTKGSGYIYEALLRPFVTEHETDIERSLKQLRGKAWDLAIYYWQNCTELGQTKFFEIFQYLTNKPSKVTNQRSQVVENRSSSSSPPPPPPPTSFFPPPSPPPPPPPPQHQGGRWEPTAPPLPSTPRHNFNRPAAQAVYAEDLHIPPSPRKEPVWLRFRRSRGM